MKKATSKTTLVLRSPFLYYRREDPYWPFNSILNGLLAIVLLFVFFKLHHWLILLLSALVLLLLELPRWLDKPRCLLREDSVTVKRLWYTYRKFSMENLYAMGRYAEEGAEPMLFLYASSADRLRRFSEKHPKERTAIAKHYGYDPDALTDDQLRQLRLTLYLWKKAKQSNPNTAVICLTKTAWKKLDDYLEVHSLPYLVLSAPEGGCCDEY